MKAELIFSSAKMDWATPQDFFDQLNAEFHFTLDPCADDTNHKCDRFYTEKQDGLRQSWAGERVFCNPPYGKDVPKWVQKCYEETRNGCCQLAVMLLNARTDTRWFHDWIWPDKADEIRFVKGRLRFGGGKHKCRIPKYGCGFLGSKT